MVLVPPIDSCASRASEAQVKTVLLNALGDLARKKGFEVVDVASNAGFCNRILEALQRNVRLESISISPIDFRGQPWLHGDVEVGLSSGRGDVRCCEARWSAHYARRDPGCLN